MDTAQLPARFRAQTAPDDLSQGGQKRRRWRKVKKLKKCRSLPPGQVEEKLFDPAFHGVQVGAGGHDVENVCQRGSTKNVAYNDQPDVLDISERSDSYSDQREQPVAKVRSIAKALSQLAMDVNSSKSNGFSLSGHLLLALLGGAGETARSLESAWQAWGEGSYGICASYISIVVFGHFFTILLPILLILLGLSYVTVEGPSLDDIDEMVKVPGKKPYWLILFTSMIAAATTSLIMGPPSFTEARQDTWWKFLGRMGKRIFTCYLLGQTLYELFFELQGLGEILAKQHATGSGAGPLLRTFMLGMLRSATSNTFGRYVDQIALLLVFNDYLNFRAAHDKDFVESWKDYKHKLENDESSEGSEHVWIWRGLMLATPYSALNEKDVEQTFAPSILDPRRLVALIKSSAARNGWIWMVYIVVLIARCWTFGWCVALVYFPLFVIAYPWVILAVLLFMVTMRMSFVKFIMYCLTNCRNPGGKTAARSYKHAVHEGGGVRMRPDELCKISKGKEEELVAQHPEGGNRLSVTPLYVNGSTVEGKFEFFRYSSDAPGYLEALQIVAEARSTTGFLPGNFDRAVPLLLYTNFYSTNDWPTFIRNGARLCYCPESVEETLKRGYERELKVIGRTGITRDGWCYIIVYAAVGKVMVDFMVVTITRFLAGAGYLESITATLTDRNVNSWMEQFDFLDPVGEIFAWVRNIW